MDALDITTIVIGWVTLVLVCCYAIPQLVKVVKTKNTAGLSIVALVFFTLCTFTLLAWGIGNACRGIIDKDLPLSSVLLTLLPNILLNALNIGVNFSCLIIKLKHVVKAKKLGIDEIKLSKILLKKAKQKTKLRKAGK